MNQTKPSKWDKLEDKLAEYVMENMDARGRTKVPLREIFKDFANKYNTTESSVSFYYYSRVKDKLDNGEYDTKTTDRENEHRDEQKQEQSVSHEQEQEQEESKNEHDEYEVQDNESESEEVVNANEVSDCDEIADPVKRETCNLINYIEENTNYQVSDVACEVIEETIKEYGAIDTMVNILNAIEDIRNMDTMFAIACDAKRRIKETPSD